MNNSLKNINILLQIDDSKTMLIYAQNRLKKLSLNELNHLEILNYSYTPDKAIEELGLELELVEQLVEDYVAQIIKSHSSFREYINKLQEISLLNNTIDYTHLRELAHKNLGVARNLRIENSQKILQIIMKSDDLSMIYYCIEALLNSVVVLKPLVAFNTIRLIKKDLL